MNVFVVSIPNEEETNKEIYKFEMNFNNLFCWRSNLGHDDIISQRLGLITGAKNDICWPKKGSGFRRPDGTTPPRIPRSNNR